MGTVSEPVEAAGSFSGSLRMRFLEPIHVPLFESLLPILRPACTRISWKLFARSLLLQIFLCHNVQLSGCRQLCFGRRLLSGFLSDPISLPILRRSTVRRAMSVEYRHATHDERRHSDQHSKTHRP